MNYITNEVQDNQQRGLLSAMFGDSRKMGLDNMIQSATVKIYNSSGEEVAYGTTDATGLAYLSATKTITSGNYTVKTTLKHKYKSYLGSGYYFVNTTHTEETLTI